MAKPVAPQNVTKSRSRSTFDLELRQAGTYRIAVAEDAVMARWEEDGKPKRWRGTRGGNGGRTFPPTRRSSKSNRCSDASRPS